MSGIPGSPRCLLCALGLLIALGGCAPPGAAPAHAAALTPQTYATPIPPAPASAAAYPMSFDGKAVSFDMSGFEPDFDPLYRVVVTGTLHDRRPPGRALPDATLVLSAYLEAFQPGTIPVLPDLLHPSLDAANLGGFLSGKSALVNAAGKVVYRGDLLAEIFADSTEHLIVDLYPVGGDLESAGVRIQGSMILRKGGAEVGTLRALQPLAAAALAMPRGRTPSWQAVVQGMGVRTPAMLGTGGPSAGHSTGQGTTLPLSTLRPQAGRAPLLPLPLAVALGAILILIILAGPVMWYRYRGWTTHRPGDRDNPLGIAPSTPADAPGSGGSSPAIGH